MTGARPLRFLALALGLWVGTRAIMLTTGPAPTAGPAAPGAVLAQTPASGTMASSPARSPAVARGRIETAAPICCLIRQIPYKARIPLVPFAEAAGAVAGAGAGARPPSPSPSPSPSGVSAAGSAGARASPFPAASLLDAAQADHHRASQSFGPPLSGASLGATPAGQPIARWSGSAWLLLRDDRGGAALAPGGTLGGSQAGARLLYRLREGLALSGRAYLPLRRRAGAELAAGIDWQPSPGLPLRFLAERRQDIGGEGRSAFALTAYGGLERRLPGGLRAEAYAQAGVVGLRSRDLFVDAVVRVGVPLGPVELGGSVWAAAQPGAARIDAGPSVSWRLPVRGSALRLQADWRFRVAGDAAPGSGPALTLAADF